MLQMSIVMETNLRNTSMHKEGRNKKDAKNMAAYLSHYEAIKETKLFHTHTL